MGVGNLRYDDEPKIKGDLKAFHLNLKITTNPTPEFRALCAELKPVFEELPQLLQNNNAGEKAVKYANRYLSMFNQFWTFVIERKPPENTAGDSEAAPPAPAREPDYTMPNGYLKEEHLKEISDAMLFKIMANNG